MGKASFRWGRENGLISYSFPLGDGRVTELWLPAEGLTAEDVGRLKAYLDTLVTSDDDSYGYICRRGSVTE